MSSLEDNGLVSEEPRTAAGEPQLADEDQVGYNAHIPWCEAVEMGQERR